MTKTSKEKQDQRKAEMQAAAERDGFETWSQAITAWKNGEARLTKEQRPKYRITLDNGDEIIYSDWSTAFQAWMDNGGALEFVR